jgi:prepilin-type N-terminal cleavage/methylation domain-containing protein
MDARMKLRGFTLIELLVVIAIIGLLSSVVLASLNTARDKARDATRRADLRTIQTALELYYHTNNSYPAGTMFSVWDGTQVSYCWNGTASGGLCPLVTGGTIPRLPHDPINVEDFVGGGNYLGSGAPGDQGYVYYSTGSGYLLGTNVTAGGSTQTRCGNYVIYNGVSSCPI